MLYFLMYQTGAAPAFLSWHGAITWAGRLGLAAGACAIAGGLLGRGKCWLLAANGVALAALGLIQAAFVRYPVRFLTIALLVVLMALSLGILEWVLSEAMRRDRRAADRWILDAAAAVSVAFALAFLALGLGWLPIRPAYHPEFFWLGSFFGFSGICMLELSLRLRRPAAEPGGQGLTPASHDPLSA